MDNDDINVLKYNITHIQNISEKYILTRYVRTLIFSMVLM